MTTTECVAHAADSVWSLPWLGLCHVDSQLPMPRATLRSILDLKHACMGPWGKEKGTQGHGNACVDLRKEESCRSKQAAASSWGIHTQTILSSVML